jgi:hypothetical protein
MVSLGIMSHISMRIAEKDAASPLAYGRSSAVELTKQLVSSEELLLIVARELARLIEKYGYNSVRRIVEIRASLYKDSFKSVEVGRTFAKSLQSGKLKLSQPYIIKEIDTPIKGSIIFLPPLFISVDKLIKTEGSYLVFDPKEKLQTRKGKKPKEEQIPGCIGYLRFNTISEDALVVVNLQSDVYAVLTDSFKNKLKYWPEILLDGLEKFVS